MSADDSQPIGMSITDGTDQYRRLPEALRPGYFNVDELSFEALLAMSAEFADVVNFVDLTHSPHGTWQALFTADETVVMAMVLSIDIKRLEIDYLRHVDQGSASLQTYLYELARRIDVWFKALSTVTQPSALALSQKIARVIQERLAPEVHTLGDMAARTGAALDFSEFDRSWGFRVEASGVSYPLASTVARTGAAQQQRMLRSTFYALLNGFSYFKSVTPACLDKSLRSKGHDPAMGLFIAFLKLFRQVQDNANHFTRRHRDFYYRQVLRATPIDPQPESVHLVIQPTTGCDELLVAAGTAFSAGKDQAFKDVVYRSDNDVLLSDADVEALYTLHLQRDRKISPENELGYVIRMKTGRQALPEWETPDESLTAHPLMGAGPLGGGRQTARDAEIGFAVASPLLLLEAGRRCIDVHVVSEPSDVEQHMAELREARSKYAFFRQLGTLFSRFLLNEPGWLKEIHRTEILQMARARVGDAYGYVEHIFPPEDDLQWLRQHHFFKLLKAMFTVRLTTSSGWFTVTDAVIKPGGVRGGAVQHGFGIAITLGPDVEPIVPYDAELHGGAWQTSQPLMQFTLNTGADFFPYSLFNGLLLNRIELQTRVEGLKNLTAYNNYGQLDPSKPFNPFGPLPSVHSYLVFGNYEIASKTLTDLRLNLEWGELPTCPGGFKTLYQHYEQVYNNASFVATTAVLRDGRWLPDNEQEQRQTRLFDSERDWEKVSARRTIEVDVSRHFKPIRQSLTPLQFRYDLNARNGFFKIALAGPSGAFAHRDYAPLLTRVLSQNARRRRPKPVPDTPYTPLLNQMSVDYTAKSTIHVDLDRRADQDEFDERVFHLHPFGTECVYPQTMERQPYVMPQYDHDGNLFIGIRAGQLKRRLALFFHLSDDARQRVARGLAHIQWFYLTARGWQGLPAACVLSDTTDGFLTTGIVSLAIPADIGASSIMPKGLFWLRVSANGDLNAMSGLYAVRTHAVRVTRLEREQTQPVKTDWQPLATLAGIDKVWRIGPVIGGRGQETDEQLNTRINERLRHKHRASTPWDYERLVLERFPDVYKVKCFPNTVVGRDGPQPGQVLIVVVPRLSGHERGRCLTRLTSPVALARIKDFVSGLTSPFVQVDVRNPVYERIQVRCTVKFHKEIQSGYFINRVNQAISDYICPWSPQGYQARFGWTVRRKDIESHIRSLEHVEYVTNFSMLHITQDGEGKYHLDDTAIAADNDRMNIQPRYPWSLAVPARDHFIETSHAIRAIPAEVTGVDELEVGYTFIINGKSRHEEE